MTVSYDASNLTGWTGLPRLFIRFRGTIIRDALFGPVFWIIMIWHAAVLVLVGKIPILIPVDESNASLGMKPLFKSGDDAMLPPLPFNVGVVGLGLLFFTAVFYSNDCYQRFRTLHSHTVGMAAATMEWVTLVKSYSRPLSLNGGLAARSNVARAQWNATRFVLTAMHLLYYKLHGVAGDESEGGLSAEEWRMMVARQLISQDEARAFDAYGGFKPLYALTFALREAKALIDDWSSAEATRHNDLGQCMRDEMVLQHFREVAFKFRGHAGQIINMLSQPVPFPYFHLLNVMLVIQLMLLGYALGTMELPYFLSFPSVAIVAIVLIGLRALSVQLSNPFGDDLVDLPLEAYMQAAYKNAVALLTSEMPPVGHTKLPLGMSNPLEPEPSVADPSGKGKKKKKKAKDPYWGRKATSVRKWPDGLASLSFDTPKTDAALADAPHAIDISVAAQNL